MEILEQYLERRKACFPYLTISSVYMGKDGIMNDVIIVNDELVYRFIKAERDKQSFAKEAQILDFVHKHVQMRILHWALIRVRSNDLSWLLCHLGWARDVMPFSNSKAENIQQS
jgi:hypothetical protein